MATTEMEGGQVGARPSSQPKPSIGRIVLFKSKEPNDLGNGAEEVPAIITRVWSEQMVNLTVFRDNAAPITKTSVGYADDLDASGNYFAWRWPPRV